MSSLLLLLACASSSPDRLTVLAASSLTEAFTDLARVYEAQHPQVQVELAFAGSQALATQVRHGIQADLFASADEEHLEALAREGLVLAARPFAANRLVLAVSEQAEPGLELASLPQAERLVLGDHQVPAGRYADRLLDAAEDRFGAAWRAGVEARVASREPNVRLALAKVGLGEADAAIVYATDLVAVQGVRAVALPAELAPTPICAQALLASAQQPDHARGWMALVESPQGLQLLQEHGFQAPP